MRLLPKLILFSLFCSQCVRTTFSIDPNGTTLVKCSQVNLSWTEPSPVMMWVAPGREINAGDATLETIGVVNQSHLLWTVNLQTGLQISFTYITVGVNEAPFASPIAYTIVSGESDECVFGEPPSSLNATSSTSTPLPSQTSTTVSSSTTSMSSIIGTAAPDGNTTSSSKTAPASTIALAVVGGALFVLLVATLAYIFRLRHRASDARTQLAALSEKASSPTDSAHRTEGAQQSVAIPSPTPCVAPSSSRQIGSWHPGNRPVSSIYTEHTGPPAYRSDDGRGGSYYQSTYSSPGHALSPSR